MSKIVLDRPSPQVATLTFANPPAKIVGADMVVDPLKIIGQLETDPDVKVVVLSRATPAVFVNHFDLAAVGDLPSPQSADGTYFRRMRTRQHPGPLHDGSSL